MELLGEYFEQAGLEEPEWAAYSSGKELIEKEREEGRRPDIAFLDIEMPGQSGIETGRMLAEYCGHCKIFILTSYADYLDDAMRFHVFRYLSKPLERERLFRNMKDAIYQLSIETRPVLIETQNTVLTRYADEIVMVEARGRDMMLHVQEGEYRTLRNMRHWESELLCMDCFSRVHRGYIVNLRYVRSFTSTMISLGAGEREWTAYVSRRRYPAFKNAYLTYLWGMR